MSTNVLLEVENLRVAYGGIQAVKGANFKVVEGELVSLIGANGAGKTTTLKAVTGIQPIAASSALKLPVRKTAPSRPEWVRTWRPTITFSMAVISANRRMFWKVRAMPVLATSCTALGL